MPLWIQDSTSRVNTTSYFSLVCSHVVTDRRISTAELALKAEESKPGFSLLLLNIVAAEALPLNTRLSGALCFKNFIKFNWVVCSSFRSQPVETGLTEPLG